VQISCAHIAAACAASAFFRAEVAAALVPYAGDRGNGTERAGSAVSYDREWMHCRLYLGIVRCLYCYRTKLLSYVLLVEVVTKWNGWRASDGDCVNLA
jgi:hypothetical protein